MPQMPPAQSLIVVHVHAHVKPEGVEAFRAASIDNSRESRKEPGVARFDVVHSHSYLWGVPMQSLSAAPVVNTIHVVPPHDVVRLSRLYPDARLTAVSTYQRDLLAGFEPCVVGHGVPPEHFPFVESPGDYVCYLGRFLPSKGALLAIEAARQVGNLDASRQYAEQLLAVTSHGDDGVRPQVAAARQVIKARH